MKRKFNLNNTQPLSIIILIILKLKDKFFKFSTIQLGNKCED